MVACTQRTHLLSIREAECYRPTLRVISSSHINVAVAGNIPLSGYTSNLLSIYPYRTSIMISYS